MTETRGLQNPNPKCTRIVGVTSLYRTRLITSQFQCIGFRGEYEAVRGGV